MAVLRPTTISHAIGLAKLLESKNLANRSNPQYQRKPPYSSPNSSSSTPILPTPNTRPALPAPPKIGMPIKCLSQTELLARRAKGLCFNCDERFIPGHRCKTPQFLLLLIDEDPPPDDNPNPHEDILFITDPTDTTPTPERNYPNTQSTYASSPFENPENFHLSYSMLLQVILHPKPSIFRLKSVAITSLS